MLKLKVIAKKNLFQSCNFSNSISIFAALCLSHNLSEYILESCNIAHRYANKDFPQRTLKVQKVNTIAITPNQDQYYKFVEIVNIA